MIILTGDEGRVGLGEASPLPGYSADSLVDVDADFVGLGDRLAAPFDLDGDVERQIADRLIGLKSPSARFGVEMALWDLFGRRWGLPCAIRWGASADARIETATLVDLLDPATWSSGERPSVLKVKVGRPGRWSEERAGLVALGERWPGVPVRIDVNRAFTKAETSSRLVDLTALSRRSGLRIDFVEEPTSGGPWPAAGLPWARDESLQGRGPTAELVDVAALVVKPSVLGGLAVCGQWLKLGPRVIVSHCFEGPLAHAAASAWALAFAPAEVAGLGPHPGLDGWPGLSPTHVNGTRLGIPQAPGLGWRGRFE